jgi:hypothetical protein
VILLVYLPEDDPVIGSWPLSPSTYGTADVSVNNIRTMAHKLAQSEGPCGIPNTGYGFDPRVKSHIGISKTGVLAVQSFTASVYIYPAENENPIFLYASNSGIYLTYEDKKLYCNLKTRTGASNVVAGLDVTLHTWSFVAVSVDKVSKNIKWMVNDEMISKTLTSIGDLATDGKLLIGAGMTKKGVKYYSGKMARFLMVNRALTTQEMRALKIKCPRGKPVF